MTVGLRDAVREALRLARVSFQHGREREALERLQSQRPRLQAELALVSPEALLHHFRSRAPRFFLGFGNPGLTAQLQKKLFPAETGHLLEWAALNLRASSWPWLASVDAGNWRKDPFSGRVWPLDYHADISLQTADGSDIRRVWEVNRLGYFIALSRAYAITGKEDYAVKILTQFDSWLEQNPLGRGPNWSCAMEVALRAMNLLGVFTICVHAESFTPQHLSRWLQSFEQHVTYIKRI
ncbi:MAG TPA: heparinase II/III family protein [Pyrinomonadaceae bacterium]|nr:heparinase II/III family protein [Pyrinomonadaceae bacterium]